MLDLLFPNSRDSNNEGRCEAMTTPGDLPMHRCVRVGEWQRAGRLVCEAHSHKLLPIRFCDEASN
jgi:hypothetical protein